MGKVGDGGGGEGPLSPMHLFPHLCPVAPGDFGLLHLTHLSLALHAEPSFLKEGNTQSDQERLVPLTLFKVRIPRL